MDHLEFVDGWNGVVYDFFFFPIQIPFSTQIQLSSQTESVLFMDTEMNTRIFLH